MSFLAAAALVDTHIPQAPLSARLSAIESLINGRAYFCDACGFLSDAGSPCDVCMENAYNAMQANAESSFGCDPYARF